MCNCEKDIAYPKETGVSGATIKDKQTKRRERAEVGKGGGFGWGGVGWRGGEKMQTTVIEQQ